MRRDFAEYSDIETRNAVSLCENAQSSDSMQTTVNLPGSLYQKSETLAASRGADHEVDLPIIRAAQPGTLDLSNFDFDDLLT